METQICIMCGETKPLSEYYAAKRMTNGVLGRCKVCHRSEMRRVRKENADRYRAYDRERGKTPERKAMYAKKNKRLNKRPHMMQAHNAVSRAVKSGKLIRPDHCERCKIDCSPQAHHDDHSKLLEVMWLCPVCHAVRHRELGKLKTVDAPLFT